MAELANSMNSCEGLLAAGAAGGPSLSALAEMAGRMDAAQWRQLSDAAQVVANYLACHPAVAEVRYPGLTGDPAYHEASCTLRGGFGPELHLRLAGEGEWLAYVASDALATEQVLALEAALRER